MRGGLGAGALQTVSAKALAARDLPACKGLEPLGCTALSTQRAAVPGCSSSAAPAAPNRIAAAVALRKEDRRRGGAPHRAAGAARRAAVEGGTSAAAVRRRHRTWLLHHCSTAREGLGATAPERAAWRHGAGPERAARGNAGVSPCLCYSQ